MSPASWLVTLGLIGLGLLELILLWFNTRRSRSPYRPSNEFPEFRARSRSYTSRRKKAQK